MPPRRADKLRKASQIKILASGGVVSTYDPIWNLQYSEEAPGPSITISMRWFCDRPCGQSRPAALQREIYIFLGFPLSHRGVDGT
jgi:hypothetical protein